MASASWELTVQMVSVKAALTLELGRELYVSYSDCGQNGCQRVSFLERSKISVSMLHLVCMISAVSLAADHESALE